MDSMVASGGVGLPTRGLSLFADIDWSKLNWGTVNQLIVYAAVLAILVAVGVYVVVKVRKDPVQKEPPASELMTKFREMHSRGVLSDEEFRTIKTTLTERLQNELKEKDNAG
jgi:hypothetical protein